ncbi:hypothetical protein, partial [Bacteroides acidifaciens]|uniref:hypothetical protein n=1 Tax=Bacteroides acidifaciens TaxID=85831 RepID=UPI0030136253
MKAGFFLDSQREISQSHSSKLCTNSLHIFNAIRYSIVSINNIQSSSIKPVSLMEEGNHSIFRHDNFIGCFSAD